MQGMQGENTDDNYVGQIIGGISFSPKEMLVIRELVNGVSYKVMASRLSISARTVEYHIKNLMMKIGCHSKSELITFFNNNGIFHDKSKRLFEVNIRLLYKTVAICVAIALAASFYFYHQTKSVVVMDVPEFQESFLKRPELLSKVNDILKSQDGIKFVVIVGGGGAGKTTLAREASLSLKSSITWEINAETADSVYNSFFDLVSHLANTSQSQKKIETITGLTSSDEKRKRLIKLVSNILRESNNWCLLFDNVDKIKYIVEYLPHRTQYWGSGSIIITTRNEYIRDVASLKSSWVVNVGILTEQEQVEIILRYCL